jgi:hypothetical protein
MPPTTPPTIAPVWLVDLEVAPEVVVVWTPTAVVVYIVVIGTPLLDLMRGVKLILRKKG